LYLLEINPQFLLELTDFLDLSILCIEIWHTMLCNHHYMIIIYTIIKPGLTLNY
jgi:hypothetical protein